MFDRWDDGVLTHPARASVVRLRHLPFLEEMAVPGDAAAAVTAGLLVLRLVDAWMEGPSIIALDGRAARSARNAASDIASGNGHRAILIDVVDAILASRAGDIGAVAQRLAVYARALDLDAQWALAIDVYDTILEYLHPDEDCATVVDALVRRAQCLRELGKWTEAATCCDRAISHAQRYGYVRGELRAHLGRAKLAQALGNLPVADSILAEIIHLAGVHGLTEIRSRANHERSGIAFARDEYDVALRYAYAALSECIAEHERDRLLNDIAANFYMLGVRSAVRDVFLILAATAREQSQRWASTINLMQMAAEDESREHFELYMKQLAGAALPPRLQAEFELHVGRGYNLLGEGMLAREWFYRALTTASAYSLNQLVFIVDDEIAKALRSSWKRASPTTAIVSDAAEQIAEHVRLLRELSVASSE